MRQHHEIACYEVDEKEWVWTTRKDRLVNPNLKQCRFQQCIWITDNTWMTCDGCQRDLDDDEVAKVNAYMKTIDWSKMVIHEEIGPVVINDYAIARVTFDVGEAEYVGTIPVRQDVSVISKT